MRPRRARHEAQTEEARRQRRRRRPGWTRLGERDGERSARVRMSVHMTFLHRPQVPPRPNLSCEADVPTQLAPRSACDIPHMSAKRSSRVPPGLADFAFRSYRSLFSSGSPPLYPTRACTPIPASEERLRDASPRLMYVEPTPQMQRRRSALAPH
jgi:hypothetical protein